MSLVRILAVDDDVNQLAALKRILRRSRFDVTTCANPRQALQLALMELPDLILLDVCMPGMSGHEFLRRLRRAEAAADRRHETPVIFLSALKASHQRVSGLDAGAEDYITKPFDPEELRARIRSQLRRVRQQNEHPAPVVEDRETADLESTLDGIRETLRGCETPLSDLDSNLELAGLVRQPALQKVLLIQAKKDVRKLADSLAHLADLPDTKGTCE